MRCGIAEYAQRIERSDGVLCLLRIVYALWLINNNNGVCVLYEADSSVAVQPVLLLIYHVFGFSESVDVDNHNFDIRACGELPHIGQLCAVVNKIAARGVIVNRRKMLLRYLQGFIYALANSNARNNNDKLCKSIKTVKLID